MVLEWIYRNGDRVCEIHITSSKVHIWIGHSEIGVALNTNTHVNYELTDLMPANENEKGV